MLSRFGVHASRTARAPLVARLSRPFAHDYLERLHVPVTPQDTAKMLATVGVATESELIRKSLTFPSDESLGVGSAADLPTIKRTVEHELAKGDDKMSFIGQGFYNTEVPAVVERCVLTNPMWYTAYTPYQAEISQGRLEALFNYQVTIKRITGMEMANACLLDEATAAAEAVLMAHRVQNGKRATILVHKSVFGHTLDVVKSTVHEVGIKVIETDELTPADIESHKDDLIGVLAQTPDRFGLLHDFAPIVEKVHSVGGFAIIGTDLLACTVNKPPGEMGADIVFGNGQRFGTPMGFGGPHAAFFACKKEHIRRMPGRIISVTTDVHGNRAFRMAMQTREQHIRREIATSNICTSQVLLANLNYFFTLYHGEEGLVDIAQTVHAAASRFASTLKANGFDVVQLRDGHSAPFFDTVSVKVKDPKKLVADLENGGFSVQLHQEGVISVSFDQVNAALPLQPLLSVFLASVKSPKTIPEDQTISSALIPRTSPIFRPTDAIHSIKGEHELLRYITRLGRKDITLCDSMIPLGSCTMKLNAAFEMQMYMNPKLNLHPYTKTSAANRYRYIISNLSQILCRMTGMDGVTYQSNSGATGEYVGLKTIKRYHESRKEGHRNVVLIPASAHGTNPASAAKMGLKVVVVSVDAKGYVSMEDFQAKLQEHRQNLFGMMLTVPSTHGVFEEATRSLTQQVHEAGGQIYIDGANMNAQLGLTNPATFGGDVCHLNLHKTFSIPHGGGGPGMGPVLVKKHLMPCLPSHREEPYPVYDKEGQPCKASGEPTLSSPFGSASILMISYMYALGMGSQGLRRCGSQAILSANYLASRLKPHYPILYTNTNGFVAHEFILDIRPIKADTGISEEDIAKRLMDYNFHAPTMSFPVAGTLMVEPTESETIEELDRFADAMIQIRQEISLVKSGKFDAVDNPLKNAPHTLAHVTGNDWPHSYPRETAAFPLPYLRERGKVWPAVGRINSAFAERNLHFELSEETQSPRPSKH